MACKFTYNSDGTIEKGLAPNGADSVLFKSILDLPKVKGDTEMAAKLWSQVYTDTFKRWFGDWENDSKNSSQMVDQNGEPQLMYHYTSKDFRVFSKDYAGEGTGTDSEGVNLGYFFSGEKQLFSNLGDILIPAFLDVRNPIEGEQATNAIESGDNRVTTSNDGLVSDMGVAVVFNADQIKSVYNRGSYLNNKNNVEIDNKVNNANDDFEGGEISMTTVKLNGNTVGEIHTENDGTYMTIFDTYINPQNGTEVQTESGPIIKRFNPEPNTGTYAYLKLAKLAKNQGLQLRSDRISDRMSDAAKALWNRFIASGQAEIFSDHYVFTGDPENVVSDMFLSAMDPTLISSKASKPTIDKVKDFLKKIGLSEDSIKTVTEITHEGKPISAIAMADIMHKAILIAEGKEDVSLPEEGMHFLVALIKINNPELYSSLVSKVRDYKIYKQLINSPEYTQNDLYRNENGSLNLDKIKEEAIAKVLAEYLINDLEGVTEKPELIVQAKSLWQSILDWIKMKFGKYTDPFQNVIDDINTDNLDGYGNVEQLTLNLQTPFLSATNKTLEERDEQFRKNKDTFDRIKNRVADLNITKVDSEYYKDGIKGTKRVSNLVDEYYNDLFKNKIIPEELKDFYEQNRMDGSYIHEIIEDVLNRIIDSKTGLIKDEISPRSQALDSNHIAHSAYDYIAKNILERLSTFKNGTRFLAEQIIYDQSKDMFGTIDFIAIDPDTNAVSILDWKTLFNEEFTKNLGIKDYKVEAFNIQIKQYKSILQKEYGVEKFGQLRAIPILKTYKAVKDDAGNLTNERVLSSIRIGSANPQEIKDEALKPIILKDESTGNAKLDKFVDILDSVREDLKVRWKKLGKKFDSGLNDLLKNSIYELRVSKDVQSLFTYSRVELTNLNKLLEDINKNKTNYTPEDINNVLGELNYYATLLNALQKVGGLLREEIFEDDDVAKVNKLLGAYEKAEEKVNDLRTELGNEIAKKEGIFNLLKPEKVMHFWNKFMRTMSQSQMASVQLLYKLVSKIHNRLEIQDNEERKQLEVVRQGVLNWAKNNNIDSKEAIKKLLKFKDGEWTGNLISILSEDFYKERDSILKSGETQQILNWWNDNYDIEKYAQWYDSEFTKLTQDLENNTYSADPSENERIKQYLIDKFEKRYNIAKHPASALGSHNKQVWNKNIREEKWHSTEYKFLNQPANKELLDAYNLFNSINKELVDLGIIEAWREHTFVPNIRKDFADTFSFEDGNIFKKVRNGLKVPFQNIKETIKVNNQELNYSGYINPLTGKREDKLFAAYVAEIGEWTKDPEDATKVKLSFSKKSQDLFSSYALMNRQKLKYSYLRSTEEVANTLKHIEASKGSIQTNKFGKVQRDRQGNVQIDDKNNPNTEILEQHIKGSIYGQVIQNDSDSFIEVNYNKFAEAWNNNKFFGGIKKLKIVENYKPSRISTMKVLMKMNNFNQKRILGLNFASAVSNLFGGTASTYLLNKKVFDNKDLAEASAMMVSGQWYATEEMQKRAALVDYFLPLIEDRSRIESKKLSVSASVRILSEDWIMAPQRKTDEIVQLNIFLATIGNITVENGELVNIRDLVKSQNNWDSRFTLSNSDRVALEKKVDNEIDEMKKTRALSKIATFSKQNINGKEELFLEIPGVDRNSETVHKLRNTVRTITKDALGSSSEFDLAAYKYNIWMRLFMTFKNWIPKALDVRFGEFRYDVGHDSYEWGRARMFYRAFGTDLMKSIAKLTPYIGRAVANKEDKTYLINKAKDLYQEKMNSLKDLGLYDESQFISESDFIESYIKGVDNAFTEFRTIMIMMAILMSAILNPDPDDDPETRNFKKKIVRQMDKFSDELSFFYSVNSFLDVMGSKPLPVIGFMSDVSKLVGNTAEEFFGMVFQNDEWKDSAKPLKYLFKAFPLSKEFLGYLPIIDPELAEEMGIKLQTQNRN